MVVAAADPPRSTVPSHRLPTGGAYRSQRGAAAELAQTRTPDLRGYALSTSCSAVACALRARMRTASMRFSRTDSTRMQ